MKLKEKRGYTDREQQSERGEATRRFEVKRKEEKQDKLSLFPTACDLYDLHSHSLSPFPASVYLSPLSLDIHNLIYRKGLPGSSPTFIWSNPALRPANES